MSQRAVEALLGRLITDLDFRTKFYDQPSATCDKEAFELTTRELEALLLLDEASLEGFAKLVDARIVRASACSDRMTAPPRGAARAGQSK